MAKKDDENRIGETYLTQDYMQRLGKLEEKKRQRIKWDIQYQKSDFWPFYGIIQYVKRNSKSDLREGMSIRENLLILWNIPWMIGLGFGVDYAIKGIAYLIEEIGPCLENILSKF